MQIERTRTRTGQAERSGEKLIHVLAEKLQKGGRMDSNNRTDSNRNPASYQEKDIKKDEKYMREAIRQAKKAYALEEVPIGCVIVYRDKIIGRGYNRRTVDKNTLAHAELTAIRKACRKIDDWRLEECTMYVTLEPCQMCSGAIVQARIPRVVVGCKNPKAGCAGSIVNLLDMKEFNHQAELTVGVLGEECSEMMKQFFRELRERQKAKKKS
jgi:tRNA(adenine34) deaminase